MKNTFTINTKKRNLIIAIIVAIVVITVGIIIGTAVYNHNNHPTTDVVENTTPSVEETVEVEETEETAPVVEETTPVETEETTPVVEETEEVETEEPTTTPETTTPSNGNNKPSTEETKPQPTEPVHTHNYINGDCSCGAHDPNYQPPHTHNYTGGDCTHPSTCSCGATGNYGSHNWNTRTWTEQIPHEGEIIGYDDGVHCKDCGFSGSSAEVGAHIDATGHIGFSNHYRPIYSDPWTETVSRSETTCSICGARQ